MHALSDGNARSDSVTSLTLYDLTAAPAKAPAGPPLEIPDFRTILPIAGLAEFARRAVMAWGVISLGAVGGMAAYYMKGGPDTLLLASKADPASVAATPQSRLAALLDVPVTADASSSRFAPPAGSNPVAAPPVPTALSLMPPTIEARLPRPRPDEPIYTGSIAPSVDDAYHAAPRGRPSLDPCGALRNLGAPYLFGSRCYRQSRAYAPPPVVYEPPQAREYAPQPYQPPVFQN